MLFFSQKLKLKQFCMIFSWIKPKYTLPTKVLNKTKSKTKTKHKINKGAIIFWLD